MIYWIYLVFASIMEICWLYSLKAMDFQAIKAIPWVNFFKSADPFLTLLPLLGYIGFGIANVILFNYACKGISASTAFGVWMGLALIGAKFIDITVISEPYTWKQLGFMGLILIGIIGLKTSAPDFEQGDSPQKQQKEIVE